MTTRRESRHRGTARRSAAWIELRGPAGAALVGLLLAIASIVLVDALVTGRGSEPEAAAPAPSATAVPDGYTTTVTVPTFAPGDGRPAQVPPSVSPPLVFATGDCADALDGLRAVMAEHPSGLALDDAGEQALNDALPGLSEDCDADTAELFQQQELGPWSVYLP